MDTWGGFPLVKKKELYFLVTTDYVNKTKDCVVCGYTFSYLGRTNAKTCSETCSRRVINDRKLKTYYLDSPGVKCCSVCGVEFPVKTTKGDKAQRKRAKYCSEDCRKESFVVRADQYRKDHPEKVSEWRGVHSKVGSNPNPEKFILRRTRANAKKRGFEFNLTIEDIVLPEICPVFGVPLIFNTYYAPSVDRIDNDKGYIKGNIQIISRKSNTMKNSATPEELRKFAEWILKNQSTN